MNPLALRFSFKSLLPCCAPVLLALVVPIWQFPVSVAHAEVRIATVDVTRILNESQDARIKRNQIDAKTAEARKKIEVKNKSLKDLEAKLKESKVSEDSKEAQAFRVQARDLSRLVKDSEADLKEQFVRMNKLLTEEALNVIKKYAEENKIDLVLDKSAKERGPVLYGDQGADITDEVIKRIDG